MENKNNNNSQNVIINQDQILPGTIKQRHLAATDTIANGDLYYGDGNNNFVRLPTGDNSSLLSSVSGVPTWLTNGTTGQFLTTNGKTVSWGTVSPPPTLPNVKFRAYRNGAYTSGTTVNKVPLETMDFDVGASFDTTNHKFVVPTTGYYLFCAASCTQPVAGNRLFLSLYKNNNEVSRGMDTNGSNVLAANLSDILYLAKDDYVELFAYTLYASVFYSYSAQVFLSCQLLSI